MSCCKNIAFISVILTAITVGYVYHKLNEIPEIVKFDVNKWWGPGTPQKIDTSVRPFKIEFTPEDIADLKSRLAATALTPPLEGVEFEYGFNTKYLKEILQFWGSDYNFTERETYLNRYPHFKTNIQGLDIHYIHIKPTVSKNVEVLPLMLVHGWPGSVKEFYEIIPLLSTPRKNHNFVFELIIPSLPGYGYSQPSSKQGLGADEAAIILRNLMHRLGHKKYYLQGGDWGAIIIRILAVYFHDEVLGIHSNMAFVGTGQATLKWMFGSIYPSLIIADEYRHWMYPVIERVQNLLEETGYMHLQATKPDTVGVALRDSPAGLAAYILEKFSSWTNRAFKKLPDGGLTKKYTLTDLLDNVMIYWTTGSITTSMRLYSESFNKRMMETKLDQIPVNVPAAIANFEYDLSPQSEYILKDNFVNIVQINYFNDGGHFAAFERPQVLADDVWSAVSTMRRVPKKSASKGGSN